MLDATNIYSRITRDNQIAGWKTSTQSLNSGVAESPRRRNQEKKTRGAADAQRPAKKHSITGQHNHHQHQHHHNLPPQAQQVQQTIDETTTTTRTISRPRSETTSYTGGGGSARPEPAAATVDVDAEAEAEAEAMATKRRLLIDAQLREQEAELKRKDAAERARRHQEEERARQVRLAREKEEKEALEEEERKKRWVSENTAASAAGGGGGDMRESVLSQHADSSARGSRTLVDPEKQKKDELLAKLLLGSGESAAPKLNVQVDNREETSTAAVAASSVSNMKSPATKYPLNPVRPSGNERKFELGNDTAPPIDAGKSDLLNKLFGNAAVPVDTQPSTTFITHGGGIGGGNYETRNNNKDLFQVQTTAGKKMPWESDHVIASPPPAPSKTAFGNTLNTDKLFQAQNEKLIFATPNQQRMTSMVGASTAADDIEEFAL